MAGKKHQRWKEQGKHNIMGKIVKMKGGGWEGKGGQHRRREMRECGITATKRVVRRHISICLQKLHKMRMSIDAYIHKYSLN